MAKRSAKRSVRRWRISRIRGAGNQYLDSVLAPDAEIAIKLTIEEFAIMDPHQQSRLVAFPESD